eukprot:1759595-Alexandrium_andersonii.AAC.1
MDRGETQSLNLRPWRLTFGILFCFAEDLVASPACPPSASCSPQRRRRRTLGAPLGVAASLF